jgi:ribosomal protein L17
MSLEERIASAAAQNKALLQTLSETDHAGPALAQQQRLIADLRTSLADSDRRVEYMAQRRFKEFRDHEKYRDSVLRRLAYKATGRGGRFAERAAKEEKEYFAALQVEQQDQAMNREIRAQLDDASRVANELQALAAKHDAAQQELDKLYEGIFGGETPGMPDEDEKERVVAVVRAQYLSARGKAEGEAVAVRLLGDAQRRMRGALASMDEALSASRFDMFSSGAFADVMERNALHRAQTEVMAARMSVIQAQRMSPLVGDMPHVDIEEGHLIRDVFFDNIFTDMAFHEEIKASEARVAHAAQYLDGMVAAAKQRQADLDGLMMMKEADLQKARAALQKEREKAFEKVSTSRT